MSSWKPDLDDRPRNSYNYSNRRDGERDWPRDRDKDRGREKDVGRERDRPRDYDRDNKERDWEREPERRVSQSRDNSVREPSRRTSSYSSPTHKLNAPAAPRADRGQEPAPNHRSSTTSAKMPAGTRGSGTVRVLVDYLSERTAIQLRKDELEDNANRRKAEHEKTKQKHGEFPSVPEYQKRVQAQDDREINTLEGKLKANEPLLLKSVQEFLGAWVGGLLQDQISQIEDRFTSQLRSHEDTANKEIKNLKSQLEAHEAEAKKKAEAIEKLQTEMKSYQVGASETSEKIEKLQSEMESQGAKAQQKIDELKVQTSRLESDLTKEERHREESQQEQERLRTLTSQHDDYIIKLRDELNAKPEASAELAIAQQQTPESKEWDSWKSVIQEMNQLQSAVDEHTRMLGDLDLDDINEACDAATSRVPELKEGLQKLATDVRSLDKKVSNLAKDMEQMQPDFHEKLASTNQEWTRLKVAQTAMITSMGAMIDDLRRQTRDLDQRVVAMAHASRPGDSTVNTTGIDAGAKAVEDLRQELGAVKIEDFEKLTTEVSSVNSRVESLYTQFEADQAAQNDRIKKLEDKRTSVSQDDLMVSKDALLQLSAQLSAVTNKTLYVDQMVQALDKRLGQLESDLMSSLQSKIEYCAVQLTVLDQRYSSISSESICSRMFAYVEQYYPNSVGTAQKLESIVKGMDDLDKRMGRLEPRSTQPSPRASGMSINPDMLGSRKRKTPPEFTNGNH